MNKDRWPKMTRRRLLAHGLRLSVLAGTGVAFAARDNLVVERVPLRFAHLPGMFKGFTVVQVSDIHASFWVGRDYIERVVDTVNRQGPDLFVLTGDTITGAVNRFWHRWLPRSRTDHMTVATRALAGVQARHRIGVLGNHDQYEGKEQAERLTRQLDAAGFTVLRNRSVRLDQGSDSIHVAGTDDWWFSGDLDKTLKQVPPDAFKILLSHNPDVTTQIRPEMKIDLTLCGHTHGGQVRVPLVTRLAMPISDPARYMAGLVREPYGYTYVNRGVGTLVFPFRLGAPPEITVFEMT